MKSTKKKGSKPRDAEHQSAFVLKRRSRKKASGRPFQKGNKLGNRFKPGESGNPGGRPSSKKYSDALRKLLELKTDEVIPTATNAELLASVVFREARKGKLGAATEIGDRCEGRAAVSVSVDSSDDPLLAIIGFMAEESKRLGPPEGSVRRQIETTETEEQQQ
jgi:hypothetical protein